MILLYNVKITQHGLSYYSRAGWMPVYDRMDIFKYCLASYATLLPLISKCIFYIRVEPEFASRHAELEAYIRELFPADKLELHWHRIEHTRDWRKFCERFTDDNELIWFAGNDDHIFMDSSLDVLESGLALLRNDPDPYSVLFYSHWPEQMRLAMHYNGELTEDGNYIKFTWRTFDAIRILKAARFKRYWEENELGDQIVFRTDTLFHIGYELTSSVYSPLRELVRHYDGYSHVSNHIVNFTPPIVIPPGFFDNDIKVRFGYPERRVNWVNCDPAHQFLYAVNPHGTDYRWVPGDIPLFWQQRISEKEINPSADINLMLDCRNQAYVGSIKQPMRCYDIDFDHTNTVPDAWLTKHLRTTIG